MVKKEKIVGQMHSKVIKWTCSITDPEMIAENILSISYAGQAFAGHEILRY